MKYQRRPKTGPLEPGQPEAILMEKNIHPEALLVHSIPRFLIEQTLIAGEEDA